MIRLLIVDDSALMRRFLARIFQSEADFEVTTARDGVEALALIKQWSPDVVTLDIEMPNMDGLTCLNRIMVEHPCPVVMVSALTEHGAEETLQALEIGAVDFIAKPGGTISLHEDELAPIIVETVRSAAQTRIRRSRRLADRVRFQAGMAPARLGSSTPHAAVARHSPLSPDAVVIVGTSTGGPPALDALLSRLPADFAWPVLVAQHMPAAFTGPLSRRLDRLCALTVVEVATATPVQRGTVYIGRGDADLVLTRRAGRLTALATPASPDYRWHPSVDRLVQSSREHLAASDIIGVLMTGMGNDGAAQMADLRAAGGHTIAEAEETAVVWGMPGELVKRDGASEVAPLPEIAARLLALVP